MLLVTMVLGVESVVIETLFRPPEASIGWWLETSPAAVFVNAGVVVLVGLLLLGLTGRPVTATLLTSALLLTLALAHHSMISTLGRPLFPWDVLLFREALNLWPYLTSMPNAHWWALGAIALASGIVATARFGPRLSLNTSLAVLAPVVAIIAWVVPAPADRLAPLGVRHLHWVQVQNYRTNGLPLTFLMNLPAANVGRPPGYSREAVARALSTGETHAVDDETPDVIVVMSEAFFDVTRIPNVHFARDPLPTLHRLQREAASGTLYPPTFGGGTANTEFELLTGHSMRLLPSGSVPYQQYLRKDIDSLPRIFASHGYRTEAVHIFHRWFWEREEVYRHLGLQRFVSMEEVVVTGGGFYPGEENLTREMKRVLEESSVPLFLFAIGVEAHGPYEPNRYPLSTIQFEGPLDSEARDELLTYAEAANHADRELGELVRYLEKRDKPAVLLFFGDHLPSLPLTLKQTGVVAALENASELTLKQRAFLYEVPLILWSNVSRGRRDLGSWSAPFLGPLLLEETRTAGTPYTDFLDGVRKKFPIVSPQFLSAPDGALLESEPPEWSAVKRDWWLIQYDSLFGSGYSNSAG